MQIIFSNRRQKTKKYCNSLRIWLFLPDTYTDVVYIKLISSKTKTDSFVYKTARNDEDKCLSLLEQIIEVNENIIQNGDSNFDKKWSKQATVTGGNV